MASADCIARLAEAAGRALSDEEVAAIFERIHKAALDLRAGRAAPGEAGIGKKLGEQLGVGQSQDQMIAAVAERAAAELLHDAAVRERQAHLQITKMGARMGDLARLTASRRAQVAAGKLAPEKLFDGLDGLLARDYSGRTNIESVEQRVVGIKADLKRGIGATWDALGNDWLGFFQDREKQLTVIRELRGEDTGEAIAAKGVKAYHNAAEQARTAFNAAGGDVGKLDDWGMPQHHSQERVAAAGREQYVGLMMSLIDRARYVDDLGRGWTDEAMGTFLGKAWDTIATDGIANLKPGDFTGSGKRASRNAESRQIHFKDAESVLQYWEKFGDRTLVEILDGHLDRMAKDIAFIEKMGPNPDLTYGTLRDQVLRDAVMLRPTETKAIRGRALASDSLFNFAAGRIKPTRNATFSNIMDGIANLNVAGKLGMSAVASFFGDKPLFEAVAHLNNIPAVQRWQNEISLLNPVNTEDRRTLQRYGLMLEYTKNGLNRFYDELGPGRSGWAAGFRTTSGKFASAVTRLTGLNAITEIRKGAGGLGMMDAIGRELKAGRKFADLDESGVRLLKTFGIAEADWRVWQLAELEKFNDHTTDVLTPESIARIPDEALLQAGIIGAADDAATAGATVRREAIVKLLGAVNTESDFAVVTPGWRERAAFYGELQRGTVKGEITRAWFQFKSFPWTVLHRGVDAWANADAPAGKALMAAWLVASTTLAGAMQSQVYDMLAGKDPREMLGHDWATFWGQALIRGGGLGIYGDFLNSINQTRYGTGVLEVTSGPTLQVLLEMGMVEPLNAIKAYAEGREVHMGRKAVQNLKGFIPGSNIWYTKAAFDHLIMQRVLEMVTPGYLASTRSRTLHDYQQDWWWQPGETAPERAPDVSGVIRK